MSKGAKQSILLLIVLLLVSIGCLGYVLMEKQKVEKARNQLTTDLAQAEDRGKKFLADIQALKEDIAKREQAAVELNRQIKKAEQDITVLKGQVAEVTDDRDKWKERIENVKKERDEIMVKVQEMTRKQQSADQEIVSYKEKIASLEKNMPPAEEVVEVNQNVMDTSPYTPVVSTVTNETDLASLLREKASLQVKIENLQQELAKSATEVIDLKQTNSGLQIQIDQMKHDKEEIDRDIKYKADMINNLSLELARTKNDKKFISDNFEKLNQENKDMRIELKKLVNSKGALEKSIVKMSEDKNNIQKKLDGTEGVIQSKIDEIWEIKNSIDETFKQAKMGTGSNEVELPPIVVNSGGGPAINANPGLVNPGLNGKVVSINPDNNFVIVDLGEKSGVTAGDTLSVYRDAKYIAKLEVIQVRKDISAADIKDQWSKIQVGDVIR